MFKALAHVGLFRSRRPAPGRQQAIPANDNLSGVFPPLGERRTALVCRWFLIDGGTRLGCRWQVELPDPPALEDPDARRLNDQTLRRKPPALAVAGCENVACGAGAASRSNVTARAMLDWPRRHSHDCLRTVLVRDPMAAAALPVPGGDKYRPVE
jgi:hypothetical protein